MTDWIGKLPKEEPEENMVPELCGDVWFMFPIAGKKNNIENRRNEKKEVYKLVPVQISTFTVANCLAHCSTLNLPSADPISGKRN